MTEERKHRGRITDKPRVESAPQRQRRGQPSRPPTSKPKNGKVLHFRYVGTGPICPDNAEHREMLDWSDGRWYCGHSDHGGNGKFFPPETK